MQGFVCRACLGRAGPGSMSQSLQRKTPLSSLLKSRSINTQSLSGYFFVTNTSLSSKEQQTHVFPTAKSPSESLQSRQKTAAATSSTSISQSQDLSTKPLDRRKRSEPALQDASTQLPLDASSKLSIHSAKLPQQSLRRTATLYLALMKPRLSFLVVLTTAAAYAIYPAPTILLPDTTVTPSLSALTLVFLSSGTALCAASANAFNMLMEPVHDAKMSRTRNRPLVRKLISSRGAALFAIACGLSGVACLYYGVNPTVSGLSLLNIVLYAGIYTPLKRISVINTWVGALVGGIPPLMGWAAASGQYATGDGHWTDLLLGPENYGGWLLAALLFAWQFPHFNALSWTIREEYKAAGYKMLAWTNPARNGRVALRYALLFFPICIGLSYAGVTDRGYIVTSTVINAWVTKEAYAFWKLEGHKGSARGLFWAGVWQLPALMVLAMVHKQGLWQNLWISLFGSPEDDVENEEDEVHLSSSRGNKASSLQSFTTSTS